MSGRSWKPRKYPSPIMVEPNPYDDLCWIVRRGMERLDGLLSDEECVIAERVLALSQPAGELFGRLTTRVPEVYDAASLGDGVDELLAADLLRAGATWPQRVSVSTLPVLRIWCVQLALSAKGKRSAIVDRLLKTNGIDDETPWVFRPWQFLIRRFERAAFLRREPDRGRLVAERLGHVAYVDYAVTGGAALFNSREQMVAWERLFSGMMAGLVGPGEALVALGRGAAWAGGRLSLERAVLRGIRAHVEELSRSKAYDEGIAWLDAVEVVTGSSERWVILRARLLERSGRADAALAYLERNRRTMNPVLALEIERFGRRLARKRRFGWPPMRPLRPAPTRILRLKPAESDHRPRWMVEERAYHVEGAVIGVVEASGRAAIRAEGGWLRLFASLILGNIVFLPVAVQLPAPLMSGPLDLGSPDFAPRRADAIQELKQRVLAGEAPNLIRESATSWDGKRVGGRQIAASDGNSCAAVAEALGPEGTWVLLDAMLQFGWRVTRGFPDLLVLAGQPCRLGADAFPSRLPESLTVVEVKGPGDTISDAQLVWFDRLLEAGIPTEVWYVEASE